ncbi:MAG: hypothetical protein JSU77_05725 [Fidelibacterota bacterium]|nr:MAG: hypothetical protein JSU77_05725 [Candidatus Neomarinimicrobiota bacterium]
MPRKALGSEFNVILWLYYFLPPFLAYTINQLILRLVGFIGMYLLLKRHFLPRANQAVLAISALSFALLPHWAIGGLTVAGQPLVLFAFLNIREKDLKLINWLIILLVPLYSSFILSYLFFLFILFMVSIYDWIAAKKLNPHFLAAIVLMTAIYILVEYRLVLNMFFDLDWISHRYERVGTESSIMSMLKSIIYVLLLSQNHSWSVHFPIIMIAAGLAAIHLQRSGKHSPKLLVISILILVIALFHGINQSALASGIREMFPQLNLFNYDRFYFLNPLLWGLLFGLSIDIIWKNLNHGKNVVYGLAVLQLVVLGYRSEFLTEMRSSGITYREFYAAELFNEVKEYIGSPVDTYRIGSVGFHPGVALYNGFSTVDMYSVNYELNYKHRFRKVIAGELEKNRAMKDNFDNWGNRAYIFSSELWLMSLSDMAGGMTISRLNIDTTALRDLGCKFLVSAVEISNAPDISLKLLNKFNRPDLPWMIYLYSLE